VDASGERVVRWRLSAQILVESEGWTADRAGRHGWTAGHASEPGPNCHAGQIVRWLGGVQAQDYAGGKWSVGCRLAQTIGAGGSSTAGSEPEVDQAIAGGDIVRTWAYRGTLHFLAATDASWVLPLLKPFIVSANQRRYRELELDGTTLSRGGGLIRSLVEEGDPKPRSEISAALERVGISAMGQRIAYLLQWAALDRAICLGPQRGRQPTYLPLPEPAQCSPVFDRDHGLAELARRYFVSYGPATVQDFAWWSGLPAAVARAALDAAGSLVRVRVGSSEMWAGREEPAGTPDGAHLLPPFDGYLLGYRERGFALDPAFGRRVNAGGGMPKPTILVGGRVAGVWKQERRGGAVRISVELFRDLESGERSAVAHAVERYGSYLERPVELRWPESA
jgi:hypothetical protein